MQENYKGKRTERRQTQQAEFRIEATPPQLRGQYFSRLYLQEKDADQHTLVQNPLCLAFFLFCTMGNHQLEPEVTRNTSEQE